MKVLRARLYDLERRAAHEKRADLRRSQVGTGDRSEKIRTYNFGQGRVTDHRIHLTTHRIDSILDGDLDEIIDSLIQTEQAEKLANEKEVEAQ
jgi:peptide chain release factor 1